MNADPGELAAAITDDDVARVRDLLRDATEADRKAYAKALRPLFDGPASGRSATRGGAAFLTARLALAAGVAAAHRAVRDCESWGTFAARHFDVFASVLADRRPPWLAEFADLLLRDGYWSDPGWWPPAPECTWPSWPRTPSTG
ncbi:MAG TPA: hypothetical protein VFB06_17000 [Streptosporangiaceae bacterium]|nr:hypothetical protein [Streptosporangiaceae bacterium]